MRYIQVDEYLSYLRKRVLKCQAIDGSNNTLLDCRPYHYSSKRDKTVVRVNLSKFFIDAFCSRYDDEDIQSTILILLSDIVATGYTDISDEVKERIQSNISNIYRVDDMFKDTIHNILVFSETTDPVYNILCARLNAHINKIFRLVSSKFGMDIIGLHYDNFRNTPGFNTHNYYGYYCFSTSNNELHEIVRENRSLFEVV